MDYADEEGRTGPPRSPGEGQGSRFNSSSTSSTTRAVCRQKGGNTKLMHSYRAEQS